MRSCTVIKRLSFTFVSTQQVFQLTWPKTIFFKFNLFVAAAPPTCRLTVSLDIMCKYLTLCIRVHCHPCYRSICTTSQKRATLLFTCLLAMLHRGLISRVDRSCNLKRGHCSSEQKQLKENERRPPRVKNRKLSTCMLESTTPHTTSCTSTHPPSNLLGLHCYVWSDLPVLPLSSLSHFDLMKCNLEGNWVHHASRTMLPCCSKQEWHGTEALQRESLSFRSVCLTQN